MPKANYSKPTVLFDNSEKKLSLKVLKSALSSYATLAQELSTEPKPNCEKVEILHTPLLQQRIICHTLQRSET